MAEAQGSIEYLLILAAVLAIGIVVVFAVTAMLGPAEQENKVAKDRIECESKGIGELVGYDTPYDGQANAPLEIRYRQREFTQVAESGSYSGDMMCDIGEDGAGGQFALYYDAPGLAFYLEKSDTNYITYTWS